MPVETSQPANGGEMACAQRTPPIAKQARTASSRSPPEAWQGMPAAGSAHGHYAGPAPIEQSYPHMAVSNYGIYSPNMAASAPAAQYAYGGAYAAWPTAPALSPLSHARLGQSPPLGGASAFPNSLPFPDSPPMLDAGQMLMSPSRFRKRRHLSPLISGYADSDVGGQSVPVQAPMSAAAPFSSPQMGRFYTAMASSAPPYSHHQMGGGSPLMRHQPMLKVPVSPSASTAYSPRMRPATLVLPCFLNQDNAVVPQGPLSYEMPAPSSYWEDTLTNARSFLREADAIDEDNITILEIKQMLRKYCINATGKKHVLLERIRKLQAYFREMHDKERLSTQARLPPAEAASDADSPQAPTTAAAAAI